MGTYSVICMVTLYVGAWYMFLHNYVTYMCMYAQVNL